MPKRVWILGAGFARSLKAPLLSDLFRQEEPPDAQAFFPEQIYPGLVRDIMAAQIAFNWGRDVEHLWEDAEQFLAFVDDAYSDGAPARKQRLHNLASRARRLLAGEKLYTSPGGPDGHMMANDLQRASRRALAAETSRFMMTARDGELWLPYREWASRLEPGTDTIITFNYDVLLDELGQRAPFTIPLPHETPEPGRIPVLKLHGSANWLADEATYLRLGDYEALTRPSGLHPAIAAPGRSKSPEGAAPFPRLWEMADNAIEQAQWVIFLGYRFPPTDALARLRLGRALAHSNSCHVRRIDTVLGPEVESNDSRRLSTILVASRGDRRVHEGPLNYVNTGNRVLQIHRQPIWAEDFLTAYADLARDQVWEP
jgi:hypothetical protein